MSTMVYSLAMPRVVKMLFCSLVSSVNCRIRCRSRTSSPKNNAPFTDRLTAMSVWFCSQRFVSRTMLGSKDVYGRFKMLWSTIQITGLSYTACILASSGSVLSLPGLHEIHNWPASWALVRWNLHPLINNIKFHGTASILDDLGLARACCY